MRRASHHLRRLLTTTIISTCLAASWPALALEVTAQARSMGSFTRVQFRASEKLPLETSANGNTITVTFPEAVSLDTSALSSGLRALGGSANLSADGRTLRISLAKPAGVRSFISGNGSGFDLVPSAEAATASSPLLQPNEKREPVPAERLLESARQAEEKSLPEKADAKPANRLKVSVEGDGSAARVLFEWPVPIRYKMLERFDSVRLEFDEPAEANIPTLTAAQKTIIKGISLERKGDSSIFTIRTLERPRARHFKQMRTVILDIRPREEEAAAKPAPPAEAKPVLAKAPEQKTVEPKPQAPKPVEVPVTAPEPAAKILEPTPTEPSSPTTTVKSPATTPDGIVELAFSTSENTAVAVYERNDYLWVVFNKPVKSDSQALRKAIAPLVSNFFELREPNYTLFGFARKKPFPVDVRQETNQWVVTLGHSKRPPLSIPIATNVTPGGGAITVHAQKLAEPIRLDDPIVGDALVVMPSLAPGQAVSTPRNFLELEFLSATLGAAAVLRNDTLTWQSNEAGISFQTETGLVVSQNLPAPPPVQAVPTTDYQSFLPHERWKLPERTDITQFRQEMLAHIINANEADRSAWRLRMAGGMIAAGWEREALGMMELIAQESPELAMQAKLAATRGAVQFLIGRYADAAFAFSAPELQGLEETAAWQALVNMAQGKIATLNYADASQKFFSNYPPLFQRAIGVMALENAIRNRNFSEADAILKRLRDPLSAMNFTANEQVVLDLAQAEIAAGNGDTGNAMKLFDSLSKNIDAREARAKAIFATVNIKLERQQLSHTDAIKALEALRNTWREPDVELPLLTQLATLYLAEKDHKNAMDTWRYIVAHFPGTPQSEDAAKKMAEHFVTLFNRGGAKALPPLEALTLYYEFRELTPVGPEGDEMIRNLADRLVSVELLDRASALLTHQVRFRLKDEEKARVATRLALIHLMNEKPKLALEALEVSEMEKLPEEISSTRRLLKAQAQLALEQYPDVLSTLSDDVSLQGEELKLNALWQTKDWKAVVNFLQEKLSNVDNSKVLTSTQSRDLLRLAMAHVFMTDTQQLKKLRAAFMDKLATQDMNQSFAFLTSDEGPVDHQSFEKVATSITGYQTFMDGFAKKVKEEGLSGAVQ